MQQSGSSTSTSLTDDRETANQMADFSKILEQAQQMQGRLEKIQEELANMTVSGMSGGGMVTVEADGKGQITRVRVDPSIVNSSDVEMLEDLLLVALRDAQQKSTDLARQEMSRLTGGMGLPFNLPF